MLSVVLKFSPIAKLLLLKGSHFMIKEQSSYQKQRVLYDSGAAWWQ
jgi:hypothetical protein